MMNEDVKKDLEVGKNTFDTSKKIFSERFMKVVTASIDLCREKEDVLEEADDMVEKLREMFEGERISIVVASSAFVLSMMLEDSPIDLETLEQRRDVGYQ